MSGIGDKLRHYEGVAKVYDEFRPAYPAAFLTRLAEALTAEPTPELRQGAGTVYDIGAGTGIFTRQLRALLPAVMPIVGVEPASDMCAHAAASAASLPNISFVNGAAEHLPVADGAGRAILAATAAHWFARTQFYDEAARVLRPGGVLAIVQYFRDKDRSPIVQDFLAYLLGNQARRPPKRPDYLEELQARPDFGAVEQVTDIQELPLSFAQFAGLALSSPTTRDVVDRLGQAKVERALHDIARKHAVGDDLVHYGFVFQYFLTRRVS